MTTPTRRDAQANRAKLMAAARALFAERGLDVTLDDVAARAGVGVGTAYRNFANKDELIDDLLVAQMDELIALAQSCLEVEDPWEALASFLRGSLARQVADRGLKQILFAQSRGQIRMEKAKAGLGPAVGALVQRAKDAGVVRPDVQLSDVPVINLMVGTAIDFSRDVEPELYTRYLEILLAGLRVEAPTPQTPALEQHVFEAAMTRWHGR